MRGHTCVDIKSANRLQVVDARRLTARRERVYDLQEHAANLVVDVRVIDGGRKPGLSAK